VSAAFIRELMRRAAQFVLEKPDGSSATLDDVDAALGGPGLLRGAGARLRSA
jgi:hypothetical protein